jgi:Prion-inhibition and propagation
MAEIIGVSASVIALASLFKACVEAFEIYKCVKKQDADLKKLNSKLRIEQCRLLVWGKAIGIPDRSDTNHTMLQDCNFQDVIQDTLELILQLLTDSENPSSKYGCHQLESSGENSTSSEADEQTPSAKVTAAFSHLGIHRRYAKGTAKWIIQDRKKFTLLIDESRELSSGLQEITAHLVSRRNQERAMTAQIVTIQNHETLSMISEMCDNNHPAFSVAASCRIGALSLAPTVSGPGHDWKADIEAAGEKDIQIESMED